MDGAWVVVGPGVVVGSGLGVAVSGETHPAGHRVAVGVRAHLATPLGGLSPPSVVGPTGIQVPTTIPPAAGSVPVTAPPPPPPLGGLGDGAC